MILGYAPRALLGGRRSVSDGTSPKSARYCTEKRPSSQKPWPTAISVTLGNVLLFALGLSDARTCPVNPTGKKKTPSPRNRPACSREKQEGGRREVDAGEVVDEGGTRRPAGGR
jgi:hypothetical protein